MRDHILKPILTAESDAVRLCAKARGKAQQMVDEAQKSAETALQKNVRCVLSPWEIRQSKTIAAALLDKWQRGDF